MKEMPPGTHLLFVGIQAILDVALLVLAFAAAYLLRFDFQFAPDTMRDFLIQIPFVVLVQFVALTISGARASIWRYTDLAHIKAFFYAALASLIVVASLRFALPTPHKAWRVP